MNYPKTAVGIGFFLAAAGWAHADTICVSPGTCDTNWQSFVTPINHPAGPGPKGSTYFDSYSWDGANANIADFIAGIGYFSGSPVSPAAPLSFWGNPDGSSVPSFYFQNNGQPEVVSLLSFNGGWSPYNSLGWYDVNSSAWGWILQANGTQPTQQTITFTPSQNFGLFFVPDSLTFDPSKSYYTDSTKNGLPDADTSYAAANNISLGPEAYQHFAVFQDPTGGFYIGAEDRSLQIGDGDYNDLVFHMAEVPEPGYVAVAAVLLSLLLIMKRRSASSAGN